MGAGDHIEMEAIVLTAFPNANFKVQLDNGQELLAQISGKIRQNNITIAVGDRVKVRISPYDLTRGIIYFRIKQES